MYICAESPPNSASATTKAAIITESGFRRAKKATIIAVNPYPNDIFGCN